MTTPSGGSPSTEFERLTHNLDEARAQLVATDQVLTALGRAAADLDSVLGTVVESARRLCHADVAQIHLLEGDQFRLAAAVGHSDEYWDLLLRKQIALDRGTLSAAWASTGVPSRSLTSSPTLTMGARTPSEWPVPHHYRRADVARRRGRRRALRCGGPRVDPFDDRAADVLTTFAAQAAIAIRNVDLVRALEARSTELGAQGRAARGARRGRRGGQLEPRPRRGSAHDRDPRRAAVRGRRWLDLRVRRGGPGVPGPDRLRYGLSSWSNSFGAHGSASTSTLVGRAAFRAAAAGADLREAPLDAAPAMPS